LKTWKTIQNYSVLICQIITLIFLVIATLLYPGGSISDKYSIGFDWSKNFFSNLFLSDALNGSPNPARRWAIIGMIFNSIGYGLFFLNTSRKIPQKHAAWVLRSIGVINMFFTFLIATQLHDSMVTLSSTLTMLGLFYITVFMIKTNLHWLKWFCIIGLLIFYFTLYLYGAGNWGLLAVMQKVTFLCFMFLVLTIEYFTKKEDFTPTSQK
jgi:hypothetical protein